MEIAVIISTLISAALMGAVAVMIARMRDNGDATKTIIDEQRHAFESQLQQLRGEFERREKELLRRSEELDRQAAAQFENLSNRALRRQSEELGRMNLEQVGNLLSPLRTRIEDFTRQASEQHTAQTAARKSLADQIERLMALNAGIGEEARNLTQALRSNSKVQGDWGEQLLQQLLEDFGLKEGVHYTSQATRDSGGATLTDEEGKRRRPDFLLNLPGGRTLILDSKVSLTAFADYAGASDENARREAAKRLVKSVRSHIDELYAKQYQKIVKGSAEQVLMFMPVEGAYFLAMDSDRSLTEYALRRKVVIVTATHLFSVVQLIEQMWRVDSQDRNAAEIARIGGLLYDRMAAFAKDFENVAENIRRTQEAYERCQTDISGGRQSILARAQKMKDLGAKATKVFPERYADSIREMSGNIGFPES